MDKDYTFTGFTPALTSNARILRKQMTPQERRLWYDFLRNYPVKFYRQRVIGRFIVDFYCCQAKLVIELDGSQHYTTDGITYDSIRSEILKKYKLRILRFSNNDINQNFSGVCEIIHRAVTTFYEKESR